jgi:hypothetical protein
MLARISSLLLTLSVGLRTPFPIRVKTGTSKDHALVPARNHAPRRYVPLHRLINLEQKLTGTGTGFAFFSRQIAQFFKFG